VTTNTNELKVTFYSKDSLKVEPVAFEVRPESDPDLVLYDGTQERETYVLPLDPAVQNVVFLFGDERLSVSYRNRPYLDGIRCEAEVQYDGVTVPETTFDSTAVVVSVLTIDVENNVEIYR
jgi:hypothetical protein